MNVIKTIEKFQKIFIIELKSNKLALELFSLRSHYSPQGATVLTLRRNFFGGGRDAGHLGVSEPVPAGDGKDPLHNDHAVPHSAGHRRCAHASLVAAVTLQLHASRTRRHFYLESFIILP